MTLEACQCALSIPCLSSESFQKLQSLTGINWSEVWDLIKQYGIKYGPVLIQAMEDVLTQVAPNSAWANVLSQILNYLSQQGVPIAAKPA